MKKHSTITGAERIAIINGLLAEYEALHGGEPWPVEYVDRYPIELASMVKAVGFLRAAKLLPPLSAVSTCSR